LWKETPPGDYPPIKAEQNYAVHCGHSGFVVIDLDVEHHPGQDGIGLFKTMCPDGELPKTFTVKSAAGGLHLYFRDKYSFSIGRHPNMWDGIDVLGGPGYVVGPGSYRKGAENKPDGSYVIAADVEITELPDWLRKLIFEKTKEKPSGQKGSIAYELVCQALTDNGASRDGNNWQCPVHDDRTPSMTVTDAGDNVLIDCHAGCETEHIMEALGLEMAHLYDSNLVQRTSSWEKKAPSSLLANPTRSQRAPEARTGTDVGHRPAGELARTTDTWEPADLDAWFSAETTRLTPTIGQRDDGVCLLYPGRTHSIVAETESGKSWLALYCCAQEMKQGHNVTYIDFEDDIDGIVGRLTDIADEEEVRKHFTYVRPWGPMPENVASWYPDNSLVIVDGVGEALSMHGLKDDADGFLRLDHHLMRALTTTGAAVVSLDHVPKSKDNQDSAIGTVHKTNAITGASYILRNVQPFGLGQSGYSRLFVRKDRPGYIRKECIDGGSRELAAELHVISTDPDIATTVRLKTPGSIATASDYSIRQQINDYMFGVQPEEVSKNKICENVRGERQKIMVTIDDLIASGHLENRGTDKRPRIVFRQQWRAPF
jgi:Bifunctional DNA primase/polymerase, N-terminal